MDPVSTALSGGDEIIIRDKESAQQAPHGNLVQDQFSNSSQDDDPKAIARKHILRASAYLRGLGSEYERIAWMLEDTLDLLAAAELDSGVDYDSDFAVLTREFVPVSKLISEAE